MKSKICIACVICAIIFCFSGCKSDDYKSAVTLQESGDYAAALEIYTTLGSYKDSADRASQCSNAISYQNAVELQSAGSYTEALEIYNAIKGYQDTDERIVYCESMIAAIDAYNAATQSLSAKNDALSSEISAAEDLVTSGDPALDPDLAPALEAAITDAREALAALIDMPEDADAILAAAADMEAVDYAQASDAITSAQSALEQSIAQYALVNAPAEDYVVDCLSRVPGVIAVAAATEDTDDNNLLGKAGSYYARIVFSHEMVGNSSAQGASLVSKGTDCGGSIEVFNTVEDAEKRNIYLGAFDGTFIDSGSHTVIGTVLVRTSSKLKASQQQDLEAAIIEILTTLS